jgi:hypothetical protein
MSKILCHCGNVIYNQTDFSRQKGYVIPDQDYLDLIEILSSSESEQIADIIAKFSFEIFQCEACHSIILFKGNTAKGCGFTPQTSSDINQLLHSQFDKQWKGSIAANFNNGQGSLYWNTNIESGFENELSLKQLKVKYYRVYKRLANLNVLRHSFLSINDFIEHQFKA